MKHRTYTHQFTVNRHPSDAINLFTPRGEEEWVPRWEPSYLCPASGKTEEGMVFTTGRDEEITFWTCLKWRPEDGHARYLRITPASRFAYVDIQCQSDGDHRTRVRVSYEIHALTKAGTSWLEAFTEDAFSEMIDEWSVLIQRLDH